MRRRIAHFVFVTLLGTVAAAAGMLTALTLTPPGRDLLARTVSSELSRVINGSIEIGSISGSFLYDLTIERLVVRDTAGVLLADLPRVRVGYRVPNFLAGHFVLSRLHLDQPVIQILKHRGGRMNYEDVLRLGGGASGRPSPLIAFRDVRVRGGTLRLVLPWSPNPELTTERQRDSALVAERAKPGRVIEPSPEGLRRVIEFDRLTTVLRQLRISTPDHKPFTIDLDSLATRISDPQLAVSDAAGRLTFHGDSLIFSLRRGALPDTRFSGGGVVVMARAGTLYDFQIVAPHANLADLRWISPNFPTMVGRATVTAHSESPTRTAYVITSLHLQRGPQRIDGNLTALDDRHRGIGVSGLRLTLRNLDIDEVRPFAPTLPFYGTLDGPVQADGFFDGMDVKLDWNFADEEVPGRPVTHIAGAGRVVIGGLPGLVFRDFDVTESDVALGTVRRLAPAVVVPGRLSAVGRLNGPLQDVTFEGTARHQDDDRPVSEFEGTLRLDTRGDTLGLTADLALTPLSLEGIRRGFPSMTARGSLTGRVRLDGTLARLSVNGSVSGEIGTIDAEGVATVLPPKWGAEDLRITFRNLDLAAVRDTGPPTLLNGSVVLTGVADSARAPEGEFDLALASSRIREFRLDSLRLRGAVHDSVVTVDTLAGRAAAVTAQGRGTVGWTRPHEGRMQLAFAADSLQAFDSLVAATLALEPDTAADALPLSGAARGTVELAGSLDSLRVSGQAAGSALGWRRFRAPAATVAGHWTGGARPELGVSVAIDSLTLRTRAFHDIRAQADGFADSLAWGGAVTVGADVRSRLAGAGRWWTRAKQRFVAVDSLDARLPAHQWRLQQPALVALGDSAPDLSGVVLSATDGSGRISLSGSVPGDRAGALQVDAFGVGLQDLWGLLQKDTTGVSGAMGTSLAVAGTAAEPRVEGSAWLQDAVFGEFKAPFAHTVVQYANRRLQAHAGVYRTGSEIVEVTAELPMDLGLRNVKERQLPGPIMVHARADSADLAILEAVSSGIRDVQGELVAEATVQGTWEKPQITGFANVSRGAMTIPGIGVRYQAILGRAEFRGDSLLVPYALVTSGGGILQVTGGLRLENLSRPLLNLNLEANQFRAFDIRDFLSLTLSGNTKLTGPVLNAHLTGQATVDQGVLYFADLINKNVVDLSDPAIADLVDTTLIRAQNLGARFENIFLDSLRVDSLQLTMGNGVFLRSTEANIQLGGRIAVNKLRREYRPVGTLEALRGIYTLKIAFVNRDFTVDTGTVRYFGTPDLNAELNITAHHTVRSRTGEDIPIQAQITGTLYQPKLALSSPQLRTLSEADLVSYLVTGAPASEAAAFGNGAAVQSALSIITSAASSELERALISDLGVPVDYIELRPEVGVGAAAGTSGTRLGVGWRIGPRTFITLNAGFCFAQTATTPANFGASLEYRFSRAWRAQTSFEPTRSSCGIQTNYLSTNRYQLGADLFWEREF
ncbi:MAG TPA: translocation/assembly module TamB domain-containing protein [Gemmatimonadales bacterium]|nr:translocation/assembly module TamB domain-containing protein [Gemmatimonadales bacterium]